MISGMRTFLLCSRIPNVDGFGRDIFQLTEVSFWTLNRDALRVDLDAADLKLIVGLPSMFGRMGISRILGLSNYIPESEARNRATLIPSE